MSFDSISLDHDGAVSLLTLNRPDKLNSFTWAMHQEIKQAFTDVETRGCRALLITGAGRGFCAGQDLADLKLDGSPEIEDTLTENFNPLVARIRAMPFPVICAVNGVAAGAGANIAFACDIVLAARSASFLQAFARIGLIPDAGGTWTLPMRLGEARAKALAMLAEPISAEQAETWGLIWKTVDDAALMPQARALATRLASQPTRAFALIKQAMHSAPAHGFDDHLALEARLQTEAAGTADFREGVAAFLAKRKPSYTGS